MNIKDLGDRPDTAKHSRLHTASVWEPWEQIFLKFPINLENYGDVTVWHTHKHWMKREEMKN